MQNKFSKIIASEEVIERPLNAIVSEIEAILKPYQHNVIVEIEKHNGVQQTIRMKVEIKQ